MLECSNPDCCPDKILTPVSLPRPCAWRLLCIWTLIYLTCSRDLSLHASNAVHSMSPFGSATAQSLLCAGFDAGPELLTHMADGLPTGKTWLRGGESLPSPSCTQGPCKSRSVRKISCTLDADVVSISYNRKVGPALAPTVHPSTLHACIKQAF